MDTGKYWGDPARNPELRNSHAEITDEQLKRIAEDFLQSFQTLLDINAIKEARQTLAAKIITAFLKDSSPWAIGEYCVKNGNHPGLGKEIVNAFTNLPDPDQYRIRILLMDKSQ